jgi:hypothetical protein
MNRDGPHPYRPTPADRDAIDEFRQHPIGHHSPNLQRLLNMMRGAPNAGKYCLICIEPFRLWHLARMTGIRGEPPVLVEGEVFGDLREAEWSVFRRRWFELTGERLN